MLKNNAFKSFLSVLFLLVGLLAWEKTANAALWESNSDQNDPGLFVPADFSAGQKTASFIYTPSATVSIYGITILQQAEIGNEATNNVYIAETNCTTGAFIGAVSNPNSTYNFITDDSLKEYSFYWNPMNTLTPDKCYDFKLANSGSPVITQYDKTGGLTSPASFFARSIFSSSNVTFMDPKEPYFKLFTESATPSIEITNPPANVVINFYDFNYTFTATKDVGDTASVWLQLFDYDGATLSTVPQMTTQFDYPVGTTIATGNVNSFTPGNGTYELRATIFDTITGISDIATRTVIINIAGNPSNTLIASASAGIDNYCDTYSTDYICRAIAFLFTPSENIKTLLTYAKDSLLEEPPISWGLTFSNAVSAVEGENTAGYQIIPDFINTFFTWMWWILFLAACFHLGYHLFRT